MRRYLLDAMLVDALLHDRPTPVALARPWLLAHEAATSILVYGEVVESIKTRPNFPSHHRGLRALLGGVYPYFATYPIIEWYADLHPALRTPRGPGLIGDVDALIAAATLERRLTVVTADLDFTRVPDPPVMLHRATLATVQLP